MVQGTDREGNKLLVYIAPAMISENRSIDYLNLFPEDNFLDIKRMANSNWRSAPF